MKNTLLALLLIFMTTTAGASKLSKKEAKALAKKQYNDLLETNGDEIRHTLDVLKHFKREVKKDKNLRRLIRKARKKPELRAEVYEYTKRVLEDKGLDFGYLRLEGYSSASLFAIRLEFHDFTGFNLLENNSANIYQVGPGLGLSTGYHISGCLLNKASGINVGVSGTAIVLAGVKFGIYVGGNGVCFTLGAGVGLELGAGLGVYNPAVD